MRYKLPASDNNSNNKWYRVARQFHRLTSPNSALLAAENSLPCKSTANYGYHICFHLKPMRGTLAKGIQEVIYQQIPENKAKAQFNALVFRVQLPEYQLLVNTIKTGLEEFTRGKHAIWKTKQFYSRGHYGTRQAPLPTAYVRYRLVRYRGSHCSGRRPRGAEPQHTNPGQRGLRRQRAAHSVTTNRHTQSLRRVRRVRRVTGTLLPVGSSTNQR